MSKQLDHDEFKKIQKKFSPNIVLVLENFEHEENIGSAFRLADAFNVKKIFIVSNKELDTHKIEKTARNCSKTTAYEILPTTEQAISIVKNFGFEPISVEICDDSISLRDCDFSQFDGVALIMGNEKYGVSQYALDNSTNRVHIDMFGNNSSMNVSTALAIALYKCNEDILSAQLAKKNICNL